MPRPQRSYGRPGTDVIPERWASDHAVVMSKTFPDSCAISHPEKPANKSFDKATGQYTGPAPVHDPLPGPTPHYVGRCRVESEETVSDPVAGGEAVPTVTYTLVIGVGEAPDVLVDDIVGTSLGVTLRVRQIAFSSNMLERRLGCTENQS